MQKSSRDEMPSIWLKTVQSTPSFPQLSDSRTFDVAIVGGGISGLTTAYLLKQRGLKVVVLEANTIASGASGYTSAHLTCMWDERFSSVVDKHGTETAIYLLDGLRMAINFIEDTAQQEEFDCDFTRVPGYLYAEPGQKLAEVKDEFESLIKLGCSADFQSLSPLPFRVDGCIVVPQQAQFHPQKYLKALSQRINGDGSAIFEHSRVGDMSDGKTCTLVTDKGRVRAKYIVLATHTPIGVNFLQTEVAPYQTYLAAFESSTTLEEGLYWDVAEPYHYTRNISHDGRSLILVGGEDHKAGKGHPYQALEKLTSYIEERYDDVKIVAQWSSQFYIPNDALPYCGKSPFMDHTYVITGLSGDGLTGGTLGAHIVAGQILGMQHQPGVTEPVAHGSYLSPVRLPVNGLGSLINYVKTNSEVASDYVRDYLFKGAQFELDKLPKQEGAVAGSGLNKVAYYRDEVGKVHRYSAICPHLKGIVHWNPVQKSFDCPCHGSRFDSNGQVIEGPALKGLEQLSD